VQLLHHEHTIARPEQHEVLLPARRVLSERCPARMLERFGQQAIGAIASLGRPQVVDFLKVFAIDLCQRDEFQDIDRARRLLLERLELVRREDDVLILREFVALDGVVAADNLVVVLGTDVLLLEARTALLVQHVERDARL